MVLRLHCLGREKGQNGASHVLACIHGDTTGKNPMLSTASATMAPRQRFPMTTKNISQIKKKTNLKKGHSKKGTLMELLKHKDRNDEIRLFSKEKTLQYKEEGKLEATWKH